MSKILILLGDKPHETSDGYKSYTGLTKISKDDYAIAHYRDLVFKLSSESMQVLFSDETGKNVDVADFDLVYIRDFQGYEQERNCVAQYLSHNKKRFLNTDLKHSQHISKLAQYMQFYISHIPFPKSLYCALDSVDAHVKDYFGDYPVIVKGIQSRSGNDNYLVKSSDEMKAIAEQNPGAKMVVQEFIPNNGDYRYIVLGDKVTCVYKRTRQSSDDHRNNVSLGGTKEYVDMSTVPMEIQQIAVKAAQSLSREICGVDVMLNSDTGAPVILEANFNFGIKYTNKIPDELYGLADYLHEQAKSTEL